MRLHLLILAFITGLLPVLAAEPAASLLVAPPSAATQIQAVRELLQRRQPAVAERFDLAMIPQVDGLDVFEVESAADRIRIRGSSGVAMATGWNWYLKHVCHQQMTWCGSRMDLGLGDLKPVPDGRFRQVLPHQHIVYMNYCTLSYSMAWWDWERWQWEIDYMAMNGITMPLGAVGIEAVWYNALLRVGLTDAEARTFLSGPAYHAWQWMQNLEGLCGPLPKRWIDTHADLGRKLTDRQRSLGMTPIQQGFSGHVPRLFKERFPQARIRLQGDWCDCPGVGQLDPTDPLFAEFGRIFMEEEGKLFGLGGYYAADPFHESQPPKDVPKDELPRYLASVGQSIHRVFDGIDPHSTWVMQSWTIRQDIACAVPKGRLLILDLAGDKWTRTEGFWGHHFTTGQLHNFGGRIELHGNLAHVAKNNFMTAKKAWPATSSGTGLFMEGIVQNPVFYDLVLDTWWRDQPIAIADWIKGYVHRRYGATGGAVDAAWDLMTTKGPYKPGAAGIEWGSIVCARPALDCRKSGPNGEFHMEYRPEDLLAAWGLLLDDRSRCGNADGYRFDVVDVGRQVLSNYGKELHEDVRSAFARKDTAAFAQATARFIDCLTDIDRLCETRSEYRFGDWLAAARKWGGDEAETALYDRNASILLTLWGPEHNPAVNFDYAWREWSGLIRSFYIPRWRMFHAMLADRLATGEAYSEEKIPLACNRPAWRANAFFTTMAEWETRWVDTPKPDWKRLDVGSGDEVAVAGALLAKWRPVMEESYRLQKSKVAERLLAQGTRVVFQWNPEVLTADGKDIDVDAGAAIDGEGTYEVEFQFKGGSNALSIAYVALTQGGIEVMRDAHPGWAGNEHKANVYRLRLEVLANGAKYGLRMKLHGEGGGNSNGMVIIRKMKRQ